jgi:hypothetical protein
VWIVTSVGPVYTRRLLCVVVVLVVVVVVVTAAMLAAHERIRTGRRMAHFFIVDIPS